MNKTIYNRILTMSGEPASGKSTVIKELVKEYENLGLKVYVVSVGNMFREIAQEKGLTIEEFNEYMKTRKNIDELIDGKVKSYGEKINLKERPNEVYIFDSRLAWHNIPESFSIRLTVNDETAGKRVFGDKKRGEEDKYHSIEEAIQSTRNRKESEVERYKEKYGIDLQDEDNYDLVIDTSYSNVEDIAETIIKCEERYKNGQHFGKKWASPKVFLPSQPELSTCRKGRIFTIDEMIDVIQKEGYDPTQELDIINNGKYRIIREGHHRNFAVAKLGKTLIPYREEKSKDNRFTIDSKWLYGHEWFIAQDFSYEEVYPGIYEELAKKEIGEEK